MTIFKKSKAKSPLFYLTYSYEFKITVLMTKSGKYISNILLFSKSIHFAFNVNVAPSPSPQTSPNPRKIQNAPAARCGQRLVGDEALIAI